MTYSPSGQALSEPNKNEVSQQITVMILSVRIPKRRNVISNEQTQVIICRQAMTELIHVNLEIKVNMRKKEYVLLQAASNLGKNTVASAGLQWLKAQMEEPARIAAAWVHMPVTLV